MADDYKDDVIVDDTEDNDPDKTVTSEPVPLASEGPFVSNIKLGDGDDAPTYTIKDADARDDISELKSELAECPTIQKYGSQLYAGAEWKVTTARRHIYLLVTAHPFYASGSAYIVIGYDEGNYRITPVLSNDCITLSFDGDVLSIITSMDTWAILIDCGDSY